jgi:hypothetical protein
MHVLRVTYPRTDFEGRKTPELVDDFPSLYKETIQHIAIRSKITFQEAHVPRLCLLVGTNTRQASVFLCRFSSATLHSHLKYSVFVTSFQQPLKEKEKEKEFLKDNVNKWDLMGTTNLFIEDHIEQVI